MVSRRGNPDLLNCSVCGHLIAPQADRCVGCGTPGDIARKIAPTAPKSAALAFFAPWKWTFSAPFRLLRWLTRSKRNAAIAIGGFGLLVLLAVVGNKPPEQSNIDLKPVGSDCKSLYHRTVLRDLCDSWKHTTGPEPSISSAAAVFSNGGPKADDPRFDRIIDDIALAEAEMSKHPKQKECADFKTMRSAIVVAEYLNSDKENRPFGQAVCVAAERIQTEN